MNDWKKVSEFQYSCARYDVVYKDGGWYVYSTQTDNLIRDEAFATLTDAKRYCDRESR